MAYLQRKNVARNQRLCMTCNQACSYSFLFCSECLSWVHNSCDVVDESKVQQFTNLPIDFPYICRKCRVDDEGNFDFTKSMQRLNRAALAGYKKLKSCVKREVLFLEGPFLGFSGMGSLAVDTTAQFLMKHYLKDDTGIPAVTSSMDHVLFRAVSLAVCAKDSLACELRVRCCIEMVTYEHYYRYQKNHELLGQCAPDYIESCLDCAIMEEASSVWTMSALASVIQRPIMSVYPSVNSTTDVAYRALNATFKPRDAEVSNQFVRVLWSTVNAEITPGSWKPNHFVPLFDQQKPETPQKSTSRKRPASELDSSQEMDNLSDNNEDDAGNEPQMEMIQMDKAEGGQPIEFGKFMDVFEAYEKITTANPPDVHKDIPRGVKENVWFLIDNSHNVRHPERRNTFFDDCGVWDSKQGSVAKSFLLLDPTDNVILSTLKYHDGLYQKYVKNNSKNEWVVLDPQPDPNRVVVCHRYYAFLKRCTNYKRRVIWFDMPHAGDRGSEYALAEYLGDFPGFSRPVLGGATVSTSKRGRGGKSNYVRTDPKLLDEIANEIRKGNNTKPMKMYKQIQERLGDQCTLRDPRQIRNLKYSVLKRLKKEQGVSFPKLEEELLMNAEGEPTEINISHDVVTTEVGEHTTEDGSIVKFVITNGSGGEDGEGGSEVPATIEGLEGMQGMEGRIVEVDGQQAISFMGTDANGDPDPNAQTIIMVNNFKELESLSVSGEVIVQSYSAS